MNATHETDCDKINVGEILENMVGFSFEKNIVSAYLWDMQKPGCLRNLEAAEKVENQSLEQMSPHKYMPTAEPGYFLPHKTINEKTIYELLSPIRWTLIVCGKEKIKIQLPQLKILHLPENTYSSYILVRPDWHIALTMNAISDTVIQHALQNLLVRMKLG